MELKHEADKYQEPFVRSVLRPATQLFSYFFFPNTDVQDSMFANDYTSVPELNQHQVITLGDLSGQCLTHLLFQLLRIGAIYGTSLQSDEIKTLVSTDHYQWSSYFQLIYNTFFKDESLDNKYERLAWVLLAVTDIWWYFSRPPSDNAEDAKYDLNSQTPNLSFFNLFKKLIQSFKFSSRCSSLKVRFLGDVLCDRVGNDYLTLLIIGLLQTKVPKIETLIADHDMNFYEYLYLLDRNEYAPNQAGKQRHSFSSAQKLVEEIKSKEEFRQLSQNFRQTMCPIAYEYKDILGHRVMFTYAHGALPDGLLIDLAVDFANLNHYKCYQIAYGENKPFSLLCSNVEEIINAVNNQYLALPTNFLFEIPDEIRNKVLILLDAPGPSTNTKCYRDFKVRINTTIASIDSKYHQEARFIYPFYALLWYRGVVDQVSSRFHVMGHEGEAWNNNGHIIDSNATPDNVNVIQLNSKPLSAPNAPDAIGHAIFNNPAIFNQNEFKENINQRMPKAVRHLYPGYQLFIQVQFDSDELKKVRDDIQLQIPIFWNEVNASGEHDIGSILVKYPLLRYLFNFYYELHAQVTSFDDGETKEQASRIIRSFGAIIYCYLDELKKTDKIRYSRNKKQEQRQKQNRLNALHRVVFTNIKNVLNPDSSKNKDIAKKHYSWGQTLTRCLAWLVSFVYDRPVTQDSYECMQQTYSLFKKGLDQVNTGTVCSERIQSCV